MQKRRARRQLMAALSELGALVELLEWPIEEGKGGRQNYELAELGDTELVARPTIA
jgi:hypothetical protein